MVSPTKSPPHTSIASSMANKSALKMVPHCKGFPSYSPAAATRLRKSAILTASKIQIVSEKSWIDYLILSS